MIIDSLQNAHKYFTVHPLFEKAFAYINEVTPAGVEPGEYEIYGDQLRAIFSKKMGIPAAESIQAFECHDQHIDIQLCIKGKETFGWKPRGTCLAQKEGYDSEKDVTFYNDLPDTYFALTDGQFVILFPEDVHAPMIGEDEIKKLVIKVKILI